MSADDYSKLMIKNLEILSEMFLSPESQIDWESIHETLLRLMLALEKSNDIIVTESILKGAARTDMIGCQGSLLMILRASIELLPIGKAWEFADMHHSRVCQRYKEILQAHVNVLKGVENESGRTH